MQIVLDELKRNLSTVPIEKLPIFLSALAAMTAEVQLRIMMAGSAPVACQAETLLTPQEVAVSLKMSTYRVYELCRQGKLPSIHLGKSVRVKLSAVAEYLAKQG